MKPALHAPALFAAVCALTLFSGSCKRPETIAKLETKPALTVDLISPETAVWPEELAVSGRVEPWQESVISSEINGYKLDEVLVNVGDVVTRGQLLARFNEGSIRARLAEAEADVKTREAALATSSDQLARTGRLVNSGAVSEGSHKQNQAAFEADEAELASARARLSAQQLELLYARVLAPDDGVISSRTATVGTVLGSGAELFRLIRQSRLEWRAEVSASDLASAEPGHPAILKIGDGKAVRGTVRQLGPVIDARTLNGICYVDLPDPGPVKAGMFLSGTIRTGESSALHVPESSIVYRDGYTYVMRVGKDPIVRQVKVTTARRKEGLVEIEGGVSESDRLILSGGSFVNEGDLVKVVAANETAGSEGGAR